MIARIFQQQMLLVPWFHDTEAIISCFIKKTRSVAIKDENKKYTTFGKTFQQLHNILLQTYIKTFARELFFFAVNRVCYGVLV